MKEARRRAGALAKEWWPELLCAALLAAIACAGQPEDPLFAVFCAIIGAIFWMMGRRHRQRPLHVKVDKIGETVNAVHDLLLDGDEHGQDEPSAPVLKLVT